jgi:hypothetical protein
MWIGITYLLAGGPAGSGNQHNIVLLSLAALVPCLAAAAVHLRPAEVVHWLALTGPLVALVAIVQGDTLGGRAAGLGNNSNGLGLLLSVSFVAAASQIRGRFALAWASATALIGYELLQTRSQGAFLAAVAGLAALLLIDQSWKARIGVVASLLLLSVLFVPRSPDVYRWAVGPRTSRDLQVSADVRRTYLEAGISLALSHPVTGIGFGRYPAYTAMNPAIGREVSAHNTYLALAAECGLVGLALFVSLLGIAYRSAPTGSAGRTVRAVLIAYIVGLAFGSFLASWQHMVPLWILVGSLIGVHGGAGSLRSRPEPY